MPEIGTAVFRSLIAFLWRWRVYYVVAVSAAIVIGWPIVADAGSSLCGIGAIAVATLWFASLFHAGSAKGTAKWGWMVVTAVLCFAAPLTFAICQYNEQDGLRSWWLYVGIFFIGILAIVVWQSRCD